MTKFRLVADISSGMNLGPTRNCSAHCRRHLSLMSPIESVRERIAKTIGKVTVPSKVSWWNPAISKLLNKDQERREKQKTSSYVLPWHMPKFEGPQDHRRLRLLNALFTAVGKFDGRALPDDDAVKGSISFYRQHVSFKLFPSKQDRRATSKGAADQAQSLTFAVLESYHTEQELQSWSDQNGETIEQRLGEIAVEMVLLAEVNYRRGVEYRHQLRKERKAELEEKLRQQKVAIERAERERIQKLENARIDRLLNH